MMSPKRLYHKTLNQMTVTELKALCDRLRVEYRGKARKQELIDLLTSRKPGERGLINGRVMPLNHNGRSVGWIHGRSRSAEQYRGRA